MKHIKTKKIAVIDENSSRSFENAINCKMQELCKYKPELIIEHNKIFLAYIIYDYEEYFPETLSERFYLNGFRFTCKDCPHREDYLNSKGEPDGRRTDKGFCVKRQRQVLNKFDACDIFFQEKFSDFLTDEQTPLSEILSLTE